MDTYGTSEDGRAAKSNEVQYWRARVENAEALSKELQLILDEVNEARRVVGDEMEVWKNRAKKAETDNELWRTEMRGLLDLIPNHIKVTGEKTEDNNLKASVAISIVRLEEKRKKAEARVAELEAEKGPVHSENVT